MATRLHRRRVAVVRDNANVYRGTDVHALADDVANLPAVECLPPNAVERAWNRLECDALPDYAAVSANFGPHAAHVGAARLRSDPLARATGFSR